MRCCDDVKTISLPTLLNSEERMFSFAAAVQSGRSRRYKPSALHSFNGHTNLALGIAQYERLALRRVSESGDVIAVYSFMCGVRYIRTQSADDVSENEIR